MWICRHANCLASLMVAITFLVSGIVKLNDPLGFSYKMEEYLQILGSQWCSYFRFFLPYALLLAVCIATLEVVLGIALLANFHGFWTLRALLLLTLFFTALTLYTATSSRMASCGCFGDALDLTPWQSFTKSLVLLVLLGGLCWHDKSSPTSLSSYYWVMAALLVSLGVSQYTLLHLPLLDLLPYKVGNNLAGQIQPLVPLRYAYVIEKDGKTLETEEYPQEPGYKFIATRLLNPEEVPSGSNFSIWKGATECTKELLVGHQLLIIHQNGAPIAPAVLEKLQMLICQLGDDIQPVWIAASDSAQENELAKALQLPLHVANPTLLQTMLHAPLGLLHVQEGVIIGKWHYSDLKKTRAQLKKQGVL